MDVKNKIRGFLGKYFDESGVADDDNIFEIGLVNSLFAMQLVTFICNMANNSTISTYRSFFL